ncbi:MAG TPA: class I SAM-dependent methyltransferase [Jatrophihabitans sp.]|uniref:class I SAM-dependent methyltransferase n=1 Tax=Jatrophihabitans sp. TaxID=1932789 RepID=UPI002E06A0DA|nr:class I SAM-dependent methyltransferase [Jatrophihabitans sp.]
MRQVVGKRTIDLGAAAFADLRAPYERLILDIGTGDGKHVLSLARRHPEALVVGLDAGPDAMRRTAARAAAKPARGGTPNALFVWAAVERLPPELTEVTEVHVLMPWGSLLRAMVTPDEPVLSAVAAACAPDAEFLVTLNLHAWRPPVVEVGETPEPTPESARADDGLAPAYARAGWRLESADYLDDTGIAGLGTSWTKRLGSSRDELGVLALRGRIDPHRAPAGPSD